MVKISPLQNVKSPSCWAVKASSVTNFFFLVTSGTFKYLHITQNAIHDIQQLPTDSQPNN